MYKKTLVISALFLAIGCGASGKSIEMKGEEKDVILMAGQWQGTYESKDAGRKGKITFDLAVGRHTAHGQVMMYVPGSEAAPQPISVSFIGVDNSMISGQLDPYTDPTCSCEAKTTFEGYHDGDSIEGTFKIELASIGKSFTGTWIVGRK
jgi:hypothetical protein